ncbi:MAG: UDP-N-acetylglucosamine 2-epimerase, partial [Chloroflexota bacterium]|nr:UDP-N-acetylglucosamine 2-epimerase [Chloroflexota bacterium]
QQLNREDRNCEVVLCVLWGKYRDTGSFDYEEMMKVWVDRNIPIIHLDDHDHRSLPKVFVELSPNAIVMQNDVAPSESALLAVARYQGVPSLLIQESHMGKGSFRGGDMGGYMRVVRYLARMGAKEVQSYMSLSRTLVELHGNPLVPLPIVSRDMLGRLMHQHNWGCGGCTKLAVFGDQMKRNLLDRNIPEDRIVVTGCPLLDSVHSTRTSVDTNVICELLNIPCDTKKLLLLTQPFVKDGKWSAQQGDQFASTVLKAMSRIPECTTLLKIHPREKRSEYQRLLQGVGLGHIPIIQREVSLYELLVISDLVVGVNSTALLEAMCFGKPVVVVNLYQESDVFGFVTSRAVLNVEDSEVLDSAIQTALYDEDVMLELSEKREKYVYDNAYLIDGKASKRVADLIFDLAER